MLRVVIGVIAVVIFAGAGLLAANYLPSLHNGKSEKVALINSLFAPQLAQVEMVTNRIGQQFEAYRQQNDALPQEKADSAQKAIKNTEKDLRQTVQNTLKETYSLAELKEKADFETSELAQKLSAKEQQVMALMQGMGKELGRQAMLKSVDDEFSDEQAQALRKLTQKLIKNTEMTDEKRAQLLNENLDIEEQQSKMLVTLLSVSKADAVKKQKMARTNKQNISDEELALAKEYAEKTHLDSLFSENVENMTDDAKKDGVFQQAREKLFVGVADIYSKQTLRDAVDYFSRDIAQRVLEKDMQIVQKISPQIQAKLEVLNKKLSNLVQES